MKAVVRFARDAWNDVRSTWEMESYVWRGVAMLLIPCGLFASWFCFAGILWLISAVRCGR